MDASSLTEDLIHQSDSDSIYIISFNRAEGRAMRFLTFPFPSSFFSLSLSSPCPLLSSCPLSFSNRAMARFKEEGNFKQRIVPLSPQSLLNRPPQPSNLAWKTAQSCSRSKDDSKCCPEAWWGKGEGLPAGRNVHYIPHHMPRHQGSDSSPGRLSESPSFYG